MRKIVIGGIAATFGVSTALATGAFAGNPASNGAQRSGLSPTSGSTSSQCVEGSGAGTNGFVILNAPGPPGAAKKLIGEVSLKRGAPNTTYMVNVSVGNDNCMPEGTLTTNGQGNGNAHIADSTLTNGSFYVVLQLGTNEVYASGPVAVN
jgi:hypothetical protein